MPVANTVPELGVAAKNAVSSTPKPGYPIQPGRVVGPAAGRTRGQRPSPSPSPPRTRPPRRPPSAPAPRPAGTPPAYSDAAEVQFTVNLLVANKAEWVAARTE